MTITDLLLSQDKTYSEVLEVAGTLTLDPNKSITIVTNSNMIVTGKLVSKPVYPNVHTIRFTGIDESKFVGGGMDVLPSDVGLWVMGQGVLELQGEKKTGWTNATGAIKSGDTVITVKDATGWKVGDELFITPTLPNVYASEEVKIKAISGNNITVDKTLGSHPTVISQSGVKCTAEVGNLTRNLRIEGTAAGQSHIFIHSKAIQTVKHTAIRFMGPRKNQGGGAEKEFVLGRYGMHFHHCDHINGTIVEGNVVKDTGSHCYVPHGSHGIILRDNIAYNVTETAFWYDPQHKSHNLLFEKNLAATVKYVPRALDMDLKETDPDLPPSFSSSGYLIGMGDVNTYLRNVAVGTLGDYRLGAGFNWDANNEGVPIFKDNLAHNCTGGLRIWQNTENNHVIEGQIVYNCGAGVFHGAYANSYKYDLCEIINCPFIFHSASVNSSRLRLERSKLDTIIIEGSPLPGRLPILIRDCEYKSLIDQAGPPDEQGSHSVDIVNCSGVNKVDPTAHSLEVLRVQPKTGQATKITSKGTSNIVAFAPTVWGTGTGLRGEYYNDATFTKKVFERVDQFIMFPEMDNFVHYLITGKLVSMRWTGFIEPQFSENYTFLLAGAGTSKLWIDGKQITGPLAMIAGKKYPIKIEFFNNDQDLRGGMNFLWKSPSLDKFNPVPEGEYVPQSQLYPDAATPANQAPKANAGSDQTITLPINSTVLTGSATDADGTVTRYLWTKEAGPTAGAVMNPSNPSTQITGLVVGTYTFKLTVTDDKGAVGSDTVTVTVKPAIIPEPNKPPTVQVSSSVNVITTGTILLNGAGTDPEGGVLTYLWFQTSGPAVTIINPTQKNASVQNAPSGSYRFKLRVTDDKGDSTEQEVLPITF